jgi:RNA polymerase sigma-70 factor (ECF subfamily)
MTQHEIASLFDAHAMALYRYVYLRIRHQADTEDVISAVFEKVVKHHESYHEQSGATVRSWLFAITRTTLVDHFRKQGKVVLPIEDAGDIPDATRPIDESLDAQFAWDQVAEAIQQLPDRQQEIVLLRYQAGLPNTEIAHVLGINQRTVASALSKATATLRAIINPRV